MLNKKYIHTEKAARSIDSSAINDYKIPSLILMEHAAIGCVKIIKNEVSIDKKICVLCGPGNNGGDGLAIARLLHHQGYDVFTSVPSRESMSVDENIQFEMIKSLNIEYSNELDTTLKNIRASDVIIDTLFGNGLSRDIAGNYETIINEVNSSNKLVYSIDIASGIHATTGKVLNCAIKANCTITLDCFKEGHWIYPGKEYCQNLKLVDIGIPKYIHEQSDKAVYIDEDYVKSIFPKRDNHSHKGSFSKALMIGGSKEMPGAISLASKACAHSGIGTLTIMEPDCIGDILFQQMDFAMHIRCKDIDGHFDRSAVEQLNKHIDNYDFVTIGNGMQRNDETIKLVEAVLKSNKPVIVDADGLWALSNLKELLKREYDTILTPHIKEMSYICGKSVKEILEAPFDGIRDFCKEYPNCTVILKSDITYIGYKNEVYVFSNPNSALAKGGSGDILCGIIAGLYGHRIRSVDAAVCAVYTHSKCANIKKDPAVISPEDLVNELNNVYGSLRK